MNKIERFISKKAIQILKKDEISGIKERFSYNLEFQTNQVREVVHLICEENAIPLNTTSEEDIQFIEEMIGEFYDEH